MRRNRGSLGALQGGAVGEAEASWPSLHDKNSKGFVTHNSLLERFRQSRLPNDRSGATVLSIS